MKNVQFGAVDRAEGRRVSEYGSCNRRSVHEMEGRLAR